MGATKDRVAGAILEALRLVMSTAQRSRSLTNAVLPWNVDLSLMELPRDVRALYTDKQVEHCLQLVHESFLVAEDATEMTPLMFHFDVESDTEGAWLFVEHCTSPSTSDIHFSEFAHLLRSLPADENMYKVAADCTAILQRIYQSSSRKPSSGPLFFINILARSVER